MSPPVSGGEITDPFDRRVAVLLSTTVTVGPDGLCAMYSQEAKLLAHVVATLEAMSSKLDRLVEHAEREPPPGPDLVRVLREGLATIDAQNRRYR